MEKAYTMAEEPYTRIYARIDLDAIVKNMEAMRENLPAKTKMIGVVKTDGYGHGAVPVAKTIAPFVWGYAVATLEEGQNLRRHGIDKPILVLGSTHPRHFAELIEGDIRPAIFEEDKAELLSKLAVSMGKTAKMHIALDTGMGRIGFHPDENSLKEIERIAKLPGIEIEECLHILRVLTRRIRHLPIYSMSGTRNSMKVWKMQAFIFRCATVRTARRSWNCRGWDWMRREPVSRYTVCIRRMR